MFFQAVENHLQRWTRSGPLPVYQVGVNSEGSGEPERALVADPNHVALDVGDGGGVDVTDALGQLFLR